MPTVTFEVPPGARLIAFHRRPDRTRDDASIDTGLERLRQARLTHYDGLEDLMDALMTDLVSESASDDTVILGMRWQT